MTDRQESLLYTGPEEGRQLIYIVDLSANPNYIHDREVDAGLDRVRRMVPASVHRVGCNCCYGSGPDIDWEFEWNGEKISKIKFFVDFDFQPPMERY